MMINLTLGLRDIKTDITYACVWGEINHSLQKLAQL